MTNGNEKLIKLFKLKNRTLKMLIKKISFLHYCDCGVDGTHFTGRTANR